VWLCLHGSDRVAEKNHTHTKKQKNGESTSPEAVIYSASLFKANTAVHTFLTPQGYTVAKAEWWHREVSAFTWADVFHH